MQVFVLVSLISGSTLHGHWRPQGHARPRLMHTQDADKDIIAGVLQLIPRPYASNEGGRILYQRASYADVENARAEGGSKQTAQRLPSRDKPTCWGRKDERCDKHLLNLNSPSPILSVGTMPVPIC